MKKRNIPHQHTRRADGTRLSYGDHKKWHTKKKSKLSLKNVVDTERWKETFKVYGSDSTLNIVPIAHFTTLWQFAPTTHDLLPPQKDPIFLAIGQ